MNTTQIQPKTGHPCTCRRGSQRDNCRHCEGTGMRVDFALIRATPLGNYSQWIGEIYAVVETKLEVTRSDAQGIVDGQAFTLAKMWSLAASAEDAATAIIKDATP